MVKWFKPEISNLLGRLKKGKFLNQEIELESEVKDFDESVQLAVKEANLLQEASETEIPKIESEQIETEINQILDDSKNNLELAVIRLSNLLEKESKLVLGSMGFLPRGRRLVGINAVRELSGRSFLPDYMMDSLLRFWDLRNKIVHGKGDIDENEILKILDIGIVLLKAIRSIPHEVHIVKDTVDVFEDSECKNIKNGVKGIIVESKTPDGGLLRRLFHTSKTDYYKPENRVSWEWDITTKFGESWYIDKNDGSKKKIGGSLDFIGRQIEDI